MKKILLVFLFLLACDRAAFAEVSTNTGVLEVVAIKANWAADRSPTTYWYTLSGDFGSAPSSCSGEYKVTSADVNINNLLQRAYLAGLAIKAGLWSVGCVVTTVEWQ
ncbi:hypothetical protein BOSP111201_01875 [Bordetella sputigena]|uniref:hypothetical protein n=1 Tax=Bordetella sputigena TaxID=1416810 RepID=UPI0039F0DFC8